MIFSLCYTLRIRSKKSLFFAGVKYAGKVLKLAEHRKKATEFIFL